MSENFELTPEQSAMLASFLRSFHLCKNGLHRLDVPNAKTKNGQCRHCWNDYQRDWKARQRQNAKKSGSNLNRSSSTQNYPNQY